MAVDAKDFGDRFNTMVSSNAYDAFKAVNYIAKGLSNVQGRVSHIALGLFSATSTAMNCFFPIFLYGDLNALRHSVTDLLSGNDSLADSLGNVSLATADAVSDGSVLIEILSLHKIAKVSANTLKWVGLAGSLGLAISFGKKTLNTVSKIMALDFDDDPLHLKVLLVARMVKNVSFLTMGVLGSVVALNLAVVSSPVFTALGVSALAGSIFSRKVEGVCWLFPKEEWSW